MRSGLWIGVISFAASSDWQVEGDQRINFKFKGASIKAGARSFAIPPVGKGWFDNVYVDREIRVARDSRGDTLIVERCRTALKPR